MFEVFQNDKITFVDEQAFPHQWVRGDFHKVDETSFKGDLGTNQVLRDKKGNLHAQDILRQWYILERVCDFCAYPAVDDVFPGRVRLCLSCARQSIAKPV